MRRGDPQRVCVRPPLRAYRSEAVDADAVARVLNHVPMFVCEGCGTQRGRAACQTVTDLEGLGAIAIGRRHIVVKEPTLLRKQVRY